MRFKNANQRKAVMAKIRSFNYIVPVSNKMNQDYIEGVIQGKSEKDARNKLKDIAKGRDFVVVESPQSAYPISDNEIRQIASDEGLNMNEDKTRFQAFFRKRFPDEVDKGYIRQWARRWKNETAYIYGDKRTRLALKEADSLRYKYLKERYERYGY